MRDYFNAQERTRHILTLAMQSNINDFKDSTALTAEEKRYLANALHNIEKFNTSIYERYGKAYIRKIERTMQDNDLRLVAKGTKYKDCISEVAQEDLAPSINELRMLNCIDCEKTNHKDCAVYSICVACDMDSDSKNGNCPFSM